MPPNGIALVGMPLSGKTTAGVLLAERLGFGFTDTDAAIEEERGETISSIFETRGEEAFRDMESALLLRLDFRGRVVSTGGGTVLRAENRRVLRENCLVVYLRVGLDELRVRSDVSFGRPLLRGPEALKLLYGSRAAVYESVCDMSFDCGGKTPEDVARGIELWYGGVGDERTGAG